MKLKTTTVISELVKTGAHAADSRRGPTGAARGAHTNTAAFARVPHLHAHKTSDNARYMLLHTVLQSNEMTQNIYDYLLHQPTVLSSYRQLL